MTIKEQAERLIEKARVNSQPWEGWCDASMVQAKRVILFADALEDILERQGNSFGGSVSGEVLLDIIQEALKQAEEV